MSTNAALQFVRTMSYLETENKSELDTEVAKKNTEKAASACSYVWRLSLASICCGVFILMMIDMLSSEF